MKLLTITLLMLPVCGYGADTNILGNEPVYQGKPLRYWVIMGGDDDSGAPPDAVAAIRAIGPRAVPFLLEWMPHRQAGPGSNRGQLWDGMDTAWWALGPAGKSAIPTLASNLNEPIRTIDDYTVWAYSAEAISHLGPDAIIPMLTVATNMQGKHELWLLLHNFKNLETKGAPAVPALIHWANDSDYFVRDGVISALGGIGKRPELAVPVLLKALNDSDEMVRRDAAEALGAFADDSEAVLPQLIKLLKDPDLKARGGALAGLGRIRNKTEIVVPLIVPFLQDDNSVIQRSAAFALHDLGSEAGFKALLDASNAPNAGDILYELRQKARSEQSK